MERALSSAEKPPTSTSEAAAAAMAAIAAAVEEVASELRNTPAVCRQSYINPIVFEAWRRGALNPATLPPAAPGSRGAEGHALAFLRREARSTLKLNRRIMGALARLVALVERGLGIALSGGPGRR